ncbi:MAG: bacteriohemerythrin [Rhodospirillales bacterium]|jgi:hemerythrin|nr:bacteriohemerythrin [Rhodospirillales bacterium]MDP6774413.1 bacteriohemerythrin [Rhodospirillales bacterium]|tara:strand:+ start:375 stop:779 length:405 start_codon:yes stop_codon:yes gene_type:complete
MTFLPWSEDYKVNIRVIDNEHRALFDLVNALHLEISQGKGERVVGSTLSALIRHIEEHFPNEEKYMEQCGFPGLRHHVSEHERFAQTVRRFKQQFDDNPDRLNTDSLLNTLKNWITGHILKSDREMIPYLRGEK